MFKKLFFLHVPKTAGGSFRGILDDLYDNNTLEISPPPPINNLHMLGTTPIQYGHLMYHQIKHLKNHLGYDIITFLRDPVERVISHYYYILDRGIVGEVLPEEPLLSYAQRYATHQMAFTGNDLSRYSFVGISDEFESEVDRFSKLIGVPIDYNKYERRNVCNTKQPVSKEDRDIIASFCEAEIELYNFAKDLRREEMYVQK